MSEISDGTIALRGESGFKAGILFPACIWRNWKKPV